MQRQTDRRIFAFAFLIFTLWLSVGAQTQAAQASGAPLDEASATAVVREIEAMLNTQENKIHEFVVREATPERIERLYNSPRLLQELNSIRQNGLIFAGRGKLLSFDKPSDVLEKMEAWFPEEFAAVRAMKEPRFFQYIHLFGPYADWEAEPAAFIALWKCTPQTAWIRAGANPFMRRLGQNLMFLPIAGNSSATLEYDFGHCIRERAGYRPAFTEAELPRTLAEGRRIADKVTPVLAQKFAQLLSTIGCNGTGADDCVLVMRQWASLTPADASLAKAMQALEPELGLAHWASLTPVDASLDKATRALEPEPGLDNSAPRRKRRKTRRVGGDGLPEFDQGVRRAAYLRAKLQSVLGAPSAWPAQALATTLSQMTALRVAAIPAMAHQEMLYQIDYRNEDVNPWDVVAERVDQSPALKSAVLAELKRMGPPPMEGCDLFDEWFKHGGAAIPSEYALSHLADKPRSRCVWPNWKWLATEQSDAVELRGRFLDYLNRSESGAVRELMLEQMTANGAACFGKQTGVQSWLRELCGKWISEPQSVPLKLEHSKLALGKHQQFRRTRSAPPGSEGALRAQAGWLGKLVDGKGADAARAMQAVAADLEKRGLLAREAVLWRHPKHPQAFIELTLNDNHGTHLFFVAGPRGLSAFEVPARFRGEHDRMEVAQVSDLDGDGNLELWWAEGFNDCAGDASDRMRRIDCSATSADMGEISGDSLTYFANTVTAARAAAAPAPAQIEAAADASGEPERQTCNAVLVGAVLGTKLGIIFVPAEGADVRDLVDLVCKPHPLHAERTIVALFHVLRDKNGQVREDAKGFAMAVIDVNKNQVLQLYRDKVEEDATIRISSGSLRLDTARYNLAPGVHALGVRMDIGYGPNCAEGGESDYLTLLVEEGAKLRPVLKNLAMSKWGLVEGSLSCGGGDEQSSVIDNVKRSIVVLPGATAGWHDLQLIERHTIETVNISDEGSSTQVKSTEVGTTLHAMGKQYAIP